jgi:hypothetical protein
MVFLLPPLRFLIGPTIAPAGNDDLMGDPPSPIAR